MGKRFFALLTTFTAFLLVSAPTFAYEGAKGGPPDNIEGYHHLYTEVMIDIYVIGIIFAIATAYLLIRYRRRSPDQEGKPVKLSGLASVGWAIIPAFVFMADDLYLAANTWKLFNDFRRMPANSYEVELESRMWQWSYTYPEGHQTVNELRVPAGTPVVLRMKSADVIHSHYIPDFKVKEDSMPGRITYLWFYPKEPGEHVVTCAEYCGILHSRMHGKVIVMPEDEFAVWVKEKSGKEYSKLHMKKEVSKL
jgi:cytochrome c oxidase subunit 2